MEVISVTLKGITLAVSFLTLIEMATAQEVSSHTQQNVKSAKPNIDSTDNGLNLEKVIITGTPVGVSKMRASISISTMDADQIRMAVPTNSAEILRLIPGIRSESSGGEGNANLTARGVPISAGGARYVQFQEDGLPLLQFGDIAFGTPDTYLRLDTTVDNLEVVRGGSATTLATNSPGGIVNFITKTGEDRRRSFAISKGLNYNQTRYDFENGGPLTNRARFYVGGFYRVGEGVRPQAVTGEEGGQIKANFTQLLDNGYLRLNFKSLDDRVPMNLPVPVFTESQHIMEIPGIDPRSVSFYSPHWVRDAALNANNTYVHTDVNAGLHAKSNAFGAEFFLKMGNGWTVVDNFRKASNTGRFIGIFPADNGAMGVYIYATGPLAGQRYIGRAFTATVFNTSINDLGNTLNDLKLTKTFDLSNNGRFEATLGLYT